MTSNESKEIAGWSKQWPGPLPMRILLTRDKRSGEFEAFGKDFSAAAGIELAMDQETGAGMPAIQIGDTLVYHAIPLGTELAPFLEALELHHSRFEQVPDSVKKRFSRITAPAIIEIFVTQQCPFCPNAVGKLLPLACAGDFIQLSIIDGTLFPEPAESGNIRSAPTIVLNGGFRWTGAVEPEELLDIITTPDPMDFSQTVLEKLIAAGNAFQLADIMLEKGRIMPAFPAIIAHEHFTVRLAAMTIMEEIAGRNMGIASQVVGPLRKCFAKADDQARGDMIYVIGESGDEQILPWLETIMDAGCGPEIMDAVEEALEKIKSRMK